jgi:uncharacterized protein YegL
MANDDLPGGAIARRVLHFIFIADCSSSMDTDGKMQALNHSIREAIPHMRKVASENPHAEVMVRSIKFSDGALWHQATPTDVQKFTWQDLASSGGTDMGQALSLAAKAMRDLPHGEDARMFPPVLILISDGEPNSEGEFDTGLKDLMADPWGARAIRVSIAIGRGATQGNAARILKKFIGNVELPLLEANNAQDLVNYIRFVSTAVMQAGTQPPSKPKGDTSDPAAVVTPPPPKPTPPSAANQPW